MNNGYDNPVMCDFGPTVIPSAEKQEDLSEDSPTIKSEGASDSDDLIGIVVYAPTRYIIVERKPKYVAVVSPCAILVGIIMLIKLAYFYLYVLRPDHQI